MLVLGIDPGIAVTGYGFVRREGENLSCLSYGVIKTACGEKKEQRLSSIYREMEALIKKYRPQVMAVELLFFNRNTKTALTVGEARGVALLAAGLNGLPVYEYTPLQVKECLTGYGRAVKGDVREMVQSELCLDKPPTPIDASDALAIAICCHESEEDL
jgi:crossover junction endodeoxyribonuclease RuvC